MKRTIFLVLFFVTTLLAFAQDALVEIVGQLPASVSNNAVCEGFVDNTPYIYSFGGIDSTLLYSGIHLNSYRYNVLTGVSEALPDMPDTLGKIAAGANRIGDIIYIIGGYHVFADGTELSSTKVHRFDTQMNQFIEDGADIPVAIDDQVQMVWKDSLIYVVTGWSDVDMVRDVQIYNPTTDAWSQGTTLPNISAFSSFGASGGIHNDTIYYYGGATGTAWSAEHRVRRGIINGNSPTEIEWSILTVDGSKVGYRMASAQIGNRMNWIGGSNITYNYDGVAYDGSGIVNPNNRILTYLTKENYFEELTYDELPMDLRGIGRLDEFNYYICGGMLDNQVVTNKVYHLQFALVDNTAELPTSNDIKVYPNPVSSFLYLPDDVYPMHSFEIHDMIGNQITLDFSVSDNRVDVSSLGEGTYLLSVSDNTAIHHVQFVVKK